MQLIGSCISRTSNEEGCGRWAHIVCKQRHVPHLPKRNHLLALEDVTSHVVRDLSTKPDSFSAASAPLSSNAIVKRQKDREDDDFTNTEEQEHILVFQPKLGDVVRINAFAGSVAPT